MRARVRPPKPPTRRHKEQLPRTFLLVRTWKYPMKPRRFSMQCQTARLQGATYARRQRTRHQRQATVRSVARLPLCCLPLPLLARSNVLQDLSPLPAYEMQRSRYYMKHSAAIKVTFVSCGRRHACLWRWQDKTSSSLRKTNARTPCRWIYTTARRRHSRV
jgi:hypothetical protein